MFTNPHARGVQESIVCIKLLYFSILSIPVHMEVLSVLSMLVIAPIILKNVDLVYTKFEMVSNPFLDIEVFVFYDCTYCDVHLFVLLYNLPST